MSFNLLRAINEGPRSDVAQTRHDLYSRCITRVKEAIECGFYVEAVAIIESMIADRLEARVAFKYNQQKEKRRYSTAGSLAKNLMDSNDDPKQANRIYQEVIRWSYIRNHAVHQLAKLEESEEPNWDRRYQEAKDAAEEGIKLFRELDKCVGRLNRYATP